MQTTERSAHDRLLQLQKGIFRSLQQEADRLLGETPAAIRRYEAEYERDFRVGARALRRVGKADLIRTVRAAEVSFVADYHTFPQAQRTAFRLMREAIRPGEGDKWLVGLEMIPSHFQGSLDDFQAGKIDLEAFHEAMGYEEEWGFPWSNYAPIFDWAREAGVRLIALNRPRELNRASASLRRSRRDGDLHERDRWAAGIITDLLTERPGTRMIVLYGELHVASSHLPAQLSRLSRQHRGRALRSVIIHQNNDQLYWRLARSGKELNANVLRLRKDCFCVLSSTPWTKLQSLISWAEGESGHAPGMGPSAARDDDDDDLAEARADYLSWIRSYGSAIAGFLGVAAPAYEALTVRTVEDADFLDSLAREAVLSPRELRFVRHHVETNQRIYIPRAGIAYLATPSQNGAAELAAIHLHRMRVRSGWIVAEDTNGYFRSVIEAAFGFFGSLVINPRRKCDLPDDHLKRIRQLRELSRSGKLRKAQRQEMEARRLALRILRAAAHAVRGRPRASDRALARLLPPLFRGARAAPVVAMSARYVGEILGRRLHQALLAEQVSAELIRRACLTRADRDAGAVRPWKTRYFVLLRATQPVRSAGTGSKSEVF